MESDLARKDIYLATRRKVHRHACHTRHGPRISASMDKLPNRLMEVQHSLLRKTVYDEFILYKTLALFSGRGKINLPADYRLLFDSVYNTDVPPEDIRYVRHGNYKKTRTSAWRARLRRLPEPDAEVCFCGQLANLLLKKVK